MFRPDGSLLPHHQCPMADALRTGVSVREQEVHIERPNGLRGARPLRGRLNYSPVSNIGDIRSLEEGSDEGSIVLDIDEVGLDAFLQQFI